MPHQMKLPAPAQTSESTSDVEEALLRAAASSRKLPVFSALDARSGQYNRTLRMALCGGHYMFVRFKDTEHRLRVSLVETRRIDGQVKHEHAPRLARVQCRHRSPTALPTVERKRSRRRARPAPTLD